MVIDGLSNGIVRDDIDHEILIAVVDELMRLAGLKTKASPASIGSRAILMPHAARAGNDVVKFPLRAVRMEGIRDLPRRNAQDCHIERMRSLRSVDCGLRPSASERHLLAPLNFPFGETHGSSATSRVFTLSIAPMLSGYRR